MLVIRTLVISQIRSEHLSVSIDPYTGRNPSYAFVDLTTFADAQRAISELNGREMLGRPMKVKPGVARAAGSKDGSSQNFKGKSPIQRLP